MSLRAVMQKSMLEARCERTMDAIEQLRHVLVDARRKGLASVIPMAQRRIAVVQVRTDVYIILKMLVCYLFLSRC